MVNAGKVHKYRDGDPVETVTACGVSIKALAGSPDNVCNVVTGDDRNVTCGNCQRSHEGGTT